MRWWKIVGLAGLAGVAASGVITVQDERRRRAYTPDEIRARLHERVAAGVGAEDAPGPVESPTGPAGSTGTGGRTGIRGLLARLRGRR